MKKNCVLLFCFLIIHYCLSAQVPELIDSSEMIIRGSVKLSNNKPLEFATVSLLKDRSDLVASTITDSEGVYTFSNLSPGYYTLKITGLGILDTLINGIELSTKMPQRLLNDIFVHEKGIALSNVTVSSKKPLIERKIDRTILNITNELAMGNTAFTLLSKAPGVIVKPGDQIALLGKSGVRIFINDKPANMSPNDLISFLKGLNAINIKEIQVITNPSAKYEAEGAAGILNIVLKSGYNRGLKINLLQELGQGVYNKSTSSISVNYGNKKINLFGSYGLEYKTTFEENVMSKNFNLNGTKSTFLQDNFIKITNSSHFIRTGIDWKINKKNTVGFLINNNIYNETIPSYNQTKTYNTFSTLDSTLGTSSKSKNRRDDFSFNANYLLTFDTLASTFSVDVDYSSFNITSFSDYKTIIAKTNSIIQDSVLLKSDIPAEFSIKSLKFDIVKKLPKELKFEVGAKISHVSNNSNVNFKVFENGDYILDKTRTNIFNFKEQIQAAYFSISKTLGKLGFMAGLRGENTQTDGSSLSTTALFSRKYFNLFPSMHLYYDIVTDKHNLALSYSKRIRRPFYTDLNPFIYYIDPYTNIQGNPYLNPQYTNAYEISYTLKNNYSLTAFINAASDAIVQTPSQNDTTKITVLQVQNIYRSNQIGFFLSLPFEITKHWSINSSVYFYKKTFTTLRDLKRTKNSNNTMEFFLTNSFQLGKKYFLELSGLYVSPFVQGIYRTDALYSFSAALRKSFFQDKLSVNFRLDDAFRNYQVRNTIVFENQNSTINQRFDTQILWLTLTYNFSKGKNFNSRQRRLGNLDEKNRIK